MVEFLELLHLWIFKLTAYPNFIHRIESGRKLGSNSSFASKQCRKLIIGKICERCYFSGSQLLLRQYVNMTHSDFFFSTCLCISVELKYDQFRSQSKTSMRKFWLFLLHMLQLLFFPYSFAHQLLSIRNSKFMIKYFVIQYMFIRDTGT